MGKALPRLAPNSEVAVFRIFKESLANALHHARPGRIEVRAARNGSALRLEVHDDGSGFDPLAPSRQGAFGITSMKERAAACGGSLELVSHPAGAPE